MSRIGKKPIQIPAGVTVDLAAGCVSVKGPKGALTRSIPEAVLVSMDADTLVSGIDKELVGATAAKIRSFREPEPYKGKGIKYADERILRKAGKTGK